MMTSEYRVSRVRYIAFFVGISCGVVILLLFMMQSRLLEVISLSPPYPPSRGIEGIKWDFDHISVAALGSDLWPITWAGDGNLYSAWGDGGGFGGTKVLLGVARIIGSPDSFVGQNVFGGKNSEAPATFGGKSHGIISIEGALYMIVTEQGNRWSRAKIGRSFDQGRAWTFNGGDFASSDWDFAERGGVFAGASYLQFGRDYQGARDNFVYGYSEKVRNVVQPDIVMFRVSKDQVMNRKAYEFFAGLDGRGNPQWTSEINQMKPVFTDPRGVSWGMQAIYVPALQRYLLTVRSNDSGSRWGIFDAPEPWGPWTTVAYYDNWIDSTVKYTYVFNQKWMSSDGTTMWMVFSGTDSYDSFNLIKATLTLRTSAKHASRTNQSRK